MTSIKDIAATGRDEFMPAEDELIDDEIAEGDSADELFEHFAITVDKGQKMLRLD